MPDVTPRRGRRRGQAPLQPPGPDETAPVPGAGCPHHRPPPAAGQMPAPAGGVPHGMAGDQPDGPGGAAAHVRRPARQPDAARRPSARHRDRLRRSVTPPPGDSPPSQPGGSAATAPPEPPVPPEAAPPVRPRLRRQLRDVPTGTPRPWRKLACGPSRRPDAAISPSHPTSLRTLRARPTSATASTSTVMDSPPVTSNRPGNPPALRRRGSRRLRYVAL